MVQNNDQGAAAGAAAAAGTSPPTPVRKRIYLELFLDISESITFRYVEIFLKTNIEICSVTLEFFNISRIFRFYEISNQISFQIIKNIKNILRYHGDI